MANLIYFFEFINAHTELLYKFNEDIEDLLGLKAQTDPKLSTFARFVRAIIGEGYADYIHSENENDKQKPDVIETINGKYEIEDKKDSDIRFNFRRRLLKIMQVLINQKAMFTVFYSKSDPLGYDDTRFYHMIAGDLEKAEIWMNYLDRFTGNEMKKPSRIVSV